MLIRNDFGHGEAPRGIQQGSGRQQLLDSLYRCRLFQAEQLLTSWILKKLAR